MAVMKKTGTLYLVPTPLGSDGVQGIPEVNRSIVRDCQYFIVESNKLGRRHILSMAPGKDLQACNIEIMNKETDPLEYRSFLDPAMLGEPICLLSDAGSPTLADPGSPLVGMAHLKKIPVKPLVGPSSILLALMASGLNGQEFSFHGYLSPQKNNLLRQLKDLEHRARMGQTQIFMETPYRNRAILVAALKLKPDTLFCIAADLTTAKETILTKTIAKWQETGWPDLHKVPSIFLLGY